ncbi:hypothetical protein ACFLQR_04615, partial [Verrucomicrobiota bacterium]
MADDSSKTANEGTGSQPSDPSGQGARPKTVKLGRPAIEGVENKPLQSGLPSDKADTSRLDGQAGVGDVEAKKTTDDLSKAVPQTTVAERKKETSRIPLEGTGAHGAGKDSASQFGNMPTPKGPIPATIRLKRPPSATPEIRPDLGRPEDKVSTDRITLGEAPTISKKQMEKGQTSRIILMDEEPDSEAPEQAKRSTSPLGNMATPAASVPATIRLKRPTVTLGEDDTALAPDVQQITGTAKKSETAKIELPKEETVAPVPITQRKTI